MTAWTVKKCLCLLWYDDHSSCQNGLRGCQKSSSCVKNLAGPVKIPGLCVLSNSVWNNETTLLSKQNQFPVIIKFWTLEMSKWSCEDQRVQPSRLNWDCQSLDKVVPSGLFTWMYKAINTWFFELCCQNCFQRKVLGTMSILTVTFFFPPGDRDFHWCLPHPNQQLPYMGNDWLDHLCMRPYDDLLVTFIRMWRSDQTRVDSSAQPTLGQERAIWSIK